MAEPTKLKSICNTYNNCSDCVINHKCTFKYSYEERQQLAKEYREGNK